MTKQVNKRLSWIIDSYLAIRHFSCRSIGGMAIEIIGALYQFSELFSYLNSPRSQHVRKSNFPLYNVEALMMQYTAVQCVPP